MLSGAAVVGFRQLAICFGLSRVLGVGIGTVAEPVQDVKLVLLRVPSAVCMACAVHVCSWHAPCECTWGEHQHGLTIMAAAGVGCVMKCVHAS